MGGQPHPPPIGPSPPEVPRVWPPLRSRRMQVWSLVGWAGGEGEQRPGGWSEAPRAAVPLGGTVVEELSSAPGGCPPRVPPPRPPPPRCPPLLEAVRSLWRPGTHVAGLGAGGLRAAWEGAPPTPGRPTLVPRMARRWGALALWVLSHTRWRPGRRSRDRAPGSVAGTWEEGSPWTGHGGPGERPQEPCSFPKPATKLQRERRRLKHTNPMGPSPPSPCL